MTLTRLVCPHCGKQLRLKNAPIPGRRVLCSGCDRSFPAPGDTARAAAPDWATRPQPSNPAPPTITPPKPAPMPVLTPLPPEPAPAPAQGRPMMLLGVVLGGLLFLAGGSVLALFLAMKKDKQTTSATDPDENNNEKKSQRRPARDGDTSDITGSDPDDDDDPDDAPRKKDGAAAPARPRRKTRPTPRPVPKEDPWLPAAEQKKVNKAIDQGVAYLKSKQLNTGSWSSSHTTGLAALPALTLLECGVPAKDERIKKAAEFVRAQANKFTAFTYTATYELSLTLIFLDRLGDPKDKKLIQTIALRLVAGQNPDGGWTYTLPVLPEKDEMKFLTALRLTRPLDRITRPTGTGLDKTRRPGDSDSPLKGFPTRSGSGDGGKPGSTIDMQGKQPTEEEIKKAIDDLPVALRNVPALTDRPLPKNSKNPRKGPRGGFSFRQSDNSNTQFAALALWAATRHDLPLENSLARLAKRFRDMQQTDGGWKYSAGSSWGTPAMTGSGLLGLAVGHGLSATNEKKKKAVKDDAIDKGLKYLGKYIGMKFGEGKNTSGIFDNMSPINLYFLWTMERVGMLYNTRKIDGKEWYPWGVKLLLDRQDDAGSWYEMNYHGSTREVDTCLALLFLKRANLISDLSGKLEFVIQGKPGR